MESLFHRILKIEKPIELKAQTLLYSCSLRGVFSQSNDSLEFCVEGPVRFGTKKGLLQTQSRYIDIENQWTLLSHQLVISNQNIEESYIRKDRDFYFVKDKKEKLVEKVVENPMCPLAVIFLMNQFGNNLKEDFYTLAGGKQRAVFLELSGTKIKADLKNNRIIQGTTSPLKTNLQIKYGKLPSIRVEVHNAKQ